MHSMEKKKLPGMAFKLDISKAYDKVRWDFLYDVLERVGFNEKVLTLIRTMVSIVQYAILLNGSHWGNIEVGKGLRQGDLLYPYLFIMVAKVLGCSFTKLVSIGYVKGIKHATSVEAKVLKQFVDDMFLFRESSIMEAKAWKSILKSYEDCSGQKINYFKRKLYFFNTNALM